MKDSGIDWIGEIPENWIISKVKYSSAFINGFAFDSDQFSIDGKYPVIRIGDFQSNQINYNIANKIDDNSNLENYRILENDILIAMSGATVGKIAYVSKVDFPSYINQRVGIIRNDNPNFSSKYVYYSLLSPEFIKYIFYTSFGSTQPNVSGDTIMDYYITFSSLEQQEKTSLFLDLKTYGIKSLIDNLNNQIDKLKEYKKALITKCVTKGLDSNVPLKDSGIDWIGEIPENWNLIKAKRCIIIQNGSDPKTEGDIPVYGSGSSTFKMCGEFKNGPAVLLGRKGSISTPHYVEGKYWNVDTAFNVSTNEFMSLRYYFYLANCFDYSYYMSQTTLPSMTQTNYENMSIPLPNINLQNEIVYYLDKKCSEIDSLISSKQQQVDKLNEYQKSLIYEYVTGKKEVI